ncbi:MAG TPA: hypothetical protein DCM05_13395 [Elusimicrobia bacterium]|nr:hypothetical protein [Elusimicrobiota bacterium]
MAAGPETRKTNWRAVGAGVALAFAGVFLSHFLLGEDKTTNASNRQFSIIWLSTFVAGPACAGLLGGLREAALAFLLSVVAPAFAIFAYLSLAGH